VTTTSLKDLLAQRAELEAQIAATQSAERTTALQQIRSLMSDYGLTVDDLNAAKAKGPKTGSNVAAKYRDPDSGATWSGRGPRPKWLNAKIAEGKNLQDFAV